MMTQSSCVPYADYAVSIIDSVPKFIELVTGDLDVDDPIQHRQNYEHQYQTEEMAKHYNASFINKPRDKVRTIRELEILDSLLAPYAPM